MKWFSATRENVGLAVWLLWLGCLILTVAGATKLYSEYMELGRGLGRSQSVRVQEQWDRELFKILVQFGLVVLVGGALKQQYDALEKERAARRERVDQVLAQQRKDLERERTEERRRDELRVGYLERIGGAYRAAKAVRRCLRVHGLSSEANGALSRENWDRYYELMCELNSAQLALESVEIEVRGLPHPYGMKGVARSVRVMERYLGRLIREHERDARRDQVTEGLPVSKLKYLRGFTEVFRKGSRFDMRFRRRHAHVISLVNRESMKIRHIEATPQEERPEDSHG